MGTESGFAAGAIGGGLIGAFWNSGWAGRLVFLVLLGFSLASWFVIFAKALRYSRAAKDSSRFLQLFRRSKRFSEVSSTSGELSASPLVGMFQAGYAELDSQVKANRAEEGVDAASRFRIRSLAGVERALARAANRENVGFTRNLGVLATTAAVTPFVGLFGTVWGIMKSFRAIAETGSTSIVAVAPGISEALINTAAGLAAAVPALVAYNLLTGRARIFRAEMEDFGLEFLNLVERNFL
jgi:biopolymer transport protein TolQ